MSDEFILTVSSKKKIEDELERLRSVEMPALSERIRQARALGDLSENFDYQDAKRQQGMVAGKIADLQAVLDRSRVVEETARGSDTAGLGSTLTLKDLDYDDEFDYTLTDPISADPSEGLISTMSPVGKALMGRHVGDVIEVETPGGTTRFEILRLG